jgi:catechol 2,3-dioxygenase-like lactoylglutathione lyase family enzyme
MNHINNPIRIHCLDHVVLRVANLDTVLPFYVDILGCVIERRNDEIGLLQLRAGDSLIDLVPVAGSLGSRGGAAPGKEGKNMDHFCLHLQAFDEAAIVEHLQRHHIVVGETGTRFGATGDGPSIYIEDPEGNVVELKG